MSQALLATLADIRSLVELPERVAHVLDTYDAVRAEHPRLWRAYGRSGAGAFADRPRARPDESTADFQARVTAWTAEKAELVAALRSNQARRESAGLSITRYVDAHGPTLLDETIVPAVQALAGEAVGQLRQLARFGPAYDARRVLAEGTQDHHRAWRKINDLDGVYQLLRRAWLAVLDHAHPLDGRSRRDARALVPASAWTLDALVVAGVAA